MLRKSIDLAVINKYYRKFATVAAGKGVKKISDEEPKIPKDILKHYDNSDRKVALDYPESVLKKFNRRKKLDELYLADSNAADKIFDVVTKNLPADKPVIETHPGIGLLSKRLIETSNKLILFEPDKGLFQKLIVSY